MPFVDNDGIKIYYEVEGEGEPLILHHGLTGRSDRWKFFRYTKALIKNHKLVILDARGHGKSDKPHEPEAYSNKLMAGDVEAILDDLSIDASNYFGYSMGGRVGLALGKYSPSRISSMIIGGMGSTERDASFVESHREQVRLLRQGVNVFLSALEEERGSELSSEERYRWMAQDPYAIAAYRSLVDPIDFNEFLPTVAIPTLIYAGTEDGYHTSAKECAEIMPCARFVSIPDLDHNGCFFRSDLVLPHVLKFLEDLQYPKRT